MGGDRTRSPPHAGSMSSAMMCMLLLLVTTLSLHPEVGEAAPVDRRQMSQWILDAIRSDPILLDSIRTELLRMSSSPGSGNAGPSPRANQPLVPMSNNMQVPTTHTPSTTTTAAQSTAAQSTAAQSNKAARAGPCKRVGRKHLERRFQETVKHQHRNQRRSGCRARRCDEPTTGENACPYRTKWSVDFDRYPPFMPTAECIRNIVPDGRQCMPVQVWMYVLKRDVGCRPDMREQWRDSRTNIFSHCRWQEPSAPPTYTPGR